MKKSIWAGVIAVSVIVPSVSSAQSGPYRFGDTPYRLNWDYEPQIQSGCWKWNWQQYQWDDTCPVFVNPKAYMYPRASRAALRVKG